MNPPSPERYGVTQHAERMKEKGGIKKGKTHKTGNPNAECRMQELRAGANQAR
jgi:hypothetical protein